MKVSENLLGLYTAQVENQGGTYVIEVPEREVAIGGIEEGETYRVALLPSQGTTQSSSGQNRSHSQPPVDEGDIVEVEIESLGDQGDGVARVPPGYVVIVPETKVGEQATVKITEARENVGFAEIVKRHER